MIGKKIGANCGEADPVNFDQAADITGDNGDFFFPLVRGRSTVQSCPAAPAFQGLSGEIGRDSVPLCPSATPECAADACNIGAAPGGTVYIAARDILDIAAGATQLAITLKWAGKGLADAWEHDIDPPRARLVALRTLQRAQADLVALIAELDGLEVRHG